MKARGWYWAKYASGSTKSVVYYDGLVWWEIGCSSPQKEDHWYWIGPKIEEQLNIAKEALTMISIMESAPIDAVRFHEARFIAREALAKIRAVP